MGQTLSMGGQKMPWQNTDSFFGVRDFPKAVLSEVEVYGMNTHYEDKTFYMKRLCKMQSTM